MRKISVLTALLLMGIFALLAQTVEVRANGTETLGPPTGITIQKGSGIVSGGTGLVVQPGTINVNVPFGATVKQVLLYWGCKGTGVDNAITVEGNSVNGADIGGNISGSSRRADITALGLIDEGPNSLEVDDLDCPTTNMGAGVLVIFDQGISAEFSGEATVLDASVPALGVDVEAVTAGPLPPAGGADSDTAVSLDVPPGGPPGPILTSGTASASTVGAGNQSFSEAEVEDLGLDLDLLVANLINLTAGVIRAEATATCDSEGDASVSGDSFIADLSGSVAGLVNIVLPVNVPPNTNLVNVNVPMVATVLITANEQIENDTGSFAEITVNALHILVTVAGSTVADIVISSAHADIECLEVTPPQITTRIKDGMDFAFIPSPTVQKRTMVPQTFIFPGATFARTVNLTLFIGDCDSDRPDTIEIRTLNNLNAVLTFDRLVDVCSSSDGLRWDTIVVPVEIPAGATKLRVLPRSVKHASSNLTSNVADSMIWVLAAISTPTAQGITFSGRATVASASVLDVVNLAVGDTGPLPPSGGVLQENGVDVNIPGVISSGTGQASTQGAGTTSHSEASVEDLALSLLSAIIASADVLQSMATAECDNGDAQVSGASVILDLALNVAGNNIPVNISGNPNQVLLNLQVPLVGLVRIVANEQIIVDTGPTAAITVNALHISIGQGGDLGDIADVVIASSHADISCN